MKTPSTCPYCGVGCGVLIKTEAGKIIGVRGDAQPFGHEAKPPPLPGREAEKGPKAAKDALADAIR